jgi:hypothetical protein
MPFAWLPVLYPPSIFLGRWWPHGRSTLRGVVTGNHGLRTLLVPHLIPGQSALSVLVTD